jgi:hypothetical protein
VAGTLSFLVGCPQKKDPTTAFQVMLPRLESLKQHLVGPVAMLG